MGCDESHRFSRYIVVTALETTRLPAATLEELDERGYEIVLESGFFEPDAYRFGGARFVYRDGTAR